MYRAASGAEEVEVGGDFYDFIQTPEGWVVLLGDVTGKGVEAASMTSLVRHGARFLSKHEQSPGRILGRLNEELREQPGMWLCSALCARLHRDRVVISSAGPSGAVHRPRRRKDPGDRRRRPDPRSVERMEPR